MFRPSFSCQERIIVMVVVVIIIATGRLHPLMPGSRQYLPGRAGARAISPCPTGGATFVASRGLHPPEAIPHAITDPGLPSHC
jgi:hypothetical protein